MFTKIPNIFSKKNKEKGSLSQNRIEPSRQKAKTNIFEAIEKGELSLVNNIISNDPDEVFQQQKDTGNTPLHLSVKLNNIEITNYLLKVNANPLTLNIFNQSVFDVANNEKIIDILIDSVSDNAELKSEYIKAIRNLKTISANYYNEKHFEFMKKHRPLELTIYNGEYTHPGANGESLAHGNSESFAVKNPKDGSRLSR